VSATLLDFLDREKRLDPAVAAEGLLWLRNRNPVAAARMEQILEEAAELADDAAISVLAITGRDAAATTK
jgi:hypothetical protein